MHQRGSLRERVFATLQAYGIREQMARTELITMPRILGYVFNPVNFFLCRRADESLLALIVEVSNTFGERHLYVLRGEDGPSFEFPKQFYVSPFFEVDGTYRLTLEEDPSLLTVTVELYRGGEKFFVAGVREVSSLLSRTTLTGAVVRMPFAILFAMVRIHLQAFRIFAKRAASLVGWRPAEAPATVYSHQGVVHRARLRLLNLFRWFERLRAA